MAIALKNETKVISLDVLVTGFSAIESVAIKFSGADRALVEIARNALKNCARWTDDTTVTNQDKAKRQASSLLLTARSQPINTDLTGALVNFGHALDSFSHCDYRGSNLYVQSALRQLR